ncbi:energy-coupling factor ABC transporter ATP-binding protein [Clostridium sp. 'deep sea']|uniref:ABC transporter ATP-binding protein n=1 Tax=Clostridium sp. 'deep sea' TaxID=2779445 RepID=UPI0018966B11|nr:energy-coupling factor ABC transporter ATP-binding protein [Clostridium sp. 'deep sea']QOR35076.1 energy-coupling factor ABC transporter ATP-binding protein [Clostridium sp. 'deep sea']
MININNINFAYNSEKKILKDINLHVKPGQCVLLCGKSGCGKTTLTKLVNGIIPHFTEHCPYEGSVFAANLNIKDAKMFVLSQKIGSVFQNPKSQFFNIDSNSELVFALENRGINPTHIKQRLNNTINALKINKLLNRNIFNMSGGEKQNLAFASVYTMNPDIYVLDEPTANLDYKSIEILKEQLKIIKSQGKTILIAEHRLFYLKDLVDTVVYLNDGAIEQVFTAEEFNALSLEHRKKLGLRSLFKSELPHEITEKLNEKADLVVKNLSCKIKNKAIINNISFSANEGEILGFVGDNGSGKTTLMRCLAGLIKESAGTISLNNQQLKPKQRNKSCFMIMQDVNHQLFADSVKNECEISNVSNNEDDINNLLKYFNLYEYLESHPMALSGGQKQRLAIATGLLSNKKILIFDEPTSGLDYEHMLAVSNTIKQLAEKHIILIITHDIEFLNLTCSKAINIIKNTVHVINN